MDADRLTTKTQEAFSTAVRRAAADGHPQVEPVHLLLALLAQAEGTTIPVLDAAGAAPGIVKSRAEEMLARLPKAYGSTTAAPSLSRPVAAVIEAAAREAERMGDDYVSTDHLLLA